MGSVERNTLVGLVGGPGPGLERVEACAHSPLPIFPFLASVLGSVKQSRTEGGGPGWRDGAFLGGRCWGRGRKEECAAVGFHWGNCSIGGRWHLKDMFFINTFPGMFFWPFE